MFCKNFCDKVSRMKKLRLPYSCFFHAVHRGVLHFFNRDILHGENHETKSPVLTFLKKKNLKKSKKYRAKWGSKIKRTLFSIASIFKGCLSRSFWTPKLFPQTPRKQFNHAHKLHNLRGPSVQKSISSAFWEWSGVKKLKISENVLQKSL